MKSGKVKQNGKEELGKAQNSKKKLKISTKFKINTPLKSTPPNTLNASSPP
jgi:hypothetical protein